MALRGIVLIVMLLLSAVSVLGITGDMLVLDYFGSRLDYLKPNGDLKWSTRHLDSPVVVDYDPGSRAVWVAESIGQITKFDRYGNVELTLGKLPTSMKKVRLSKPRSLSVQTDGSVWVADEALNELIKFSENGKELQRILYIRYPQVILTDPADNALWVGTRESVLKLDENGTILFEISGFNTVADFALNPDRSVWVADKDNQEVVKIKADGTVLFRIENKFRRVPSLESDNQGNVWVVDKDNRKLIKLDGLGNEILSVAKSELGSPSQMQIGPHDGKLYIVNREFIYRMSSDGADLSKVLEIRHQVQMFLIIEERFDEPSTTPLEEEAVEGVEELPEPADLLGLEELSDVDDRINSIEQQVVSQDLKIKDLQKTAKDKERELQAVIQELEEKGTVANFDRGMIAAALIFILFILFFVIYLAIKKNR